MDQSRLVLVPVSAGASSLLKLSRVQHPTSTQRSFGQQSAVMMAASFEAVFVLNNKAIIE